MGMVRISFALVTDTADSRILCILTLRLPVQALCRVLPLRNFFLLPKNYSSCKSLLVHRFGALLRKAWNPRQFKGQVWD